MTQFKPLSVARIAFSKFIRGSTVLYALRSYVKSISRKDLPFGNTLKYRRICSSAYNNLISF